jgi:cbb3-type cytochrome oxidase subunit 3
MDAKLVWMGALFVAVALCVVLYFVFEQERKKIADARREMTEQDEKS